MVYLWLLHHEFLGPVQLTTPSTISAMTIMNKSDEMKKNSTIIANNSCYDETMRYIKVIWIHMRFCYWCWLGVMGCEKKVVHLSTIICISLVSFRKWCMQAEFNLHLCDKMLARLVWCDIFERWMANGFVNMNRMNDVSTAVAFCM